VEVHKIDEIYLMAALHQQQRKTLLSPDLNMNSLFHVLNLAKAKKNKKKYSGHRVLLFLVQQHQKKIPQYTIMEPSTVYGISKQSGERW
jgi:hypothetical protein